MGNKVERGKVENLTPNVKGGPRRGGRKPGVPNKATVEFRQTIQNLLDANQHNVQKWLERVAAEDPDKALQRIAQLAEYAAPKLSRAEVSGPNGGPIPTTPTVIELVSPGEPGKA